MKYLISMILFFVSIPVMAGDYFWPQPEPDVYNTYITNEYYEINSDKYNGYAAQMAALSNIHFDNVAGDNGIQIGAGAGRASGVNGFGAMIGGSIMGVLVSGSVSKATCSGCDEAVGIGLSKRF